MPRLAALSLLLVLPLAACSDTKNSDAKASTAPTVVTVKTFQFGPKHLSVDAGTEVTWRNEDAILHTVTFGTRDADSQGQPINVRKSGVFDENLDGKGTSASFTFTKAGTFTYFCNQHPGMDASVVVT